MGISNELLRVRFDKESTEFINNYGIYDYFLTCDNSEESNLMATYKNNTYYVMVAPVSSLYHFEMYDMMQKKVGNSNFSIAGFDNTIVIWDDYEVKSIEYDIILGVVKEIADYYQKNGKSKKIEISIPGFSGTFTCEKISEIINNIKKLKDAHKGKIKY